MVPTAMGHSRCDRCATYGAKKTSLKHRRRRVSICSQKGLSMTSVGLYREAMRSQPPGYAVTRPRSSTVISAENPVLLS